jgi:glycosyltransferase involved in cell wall biosynthesis
MAAGVPVITTCGSEISLMIREARCGIVCPPGDLSALVEGVLRMARRPDERWRLAERAKAFTLEEFSSEKLTAPARAWARAPHLAPDNAEKLRLRPGLSSFLDVAVNYLEETARVAQDYDVVALKKDYEDLLAIRAKSWYRTLKGIKDILLSHR